MDREAISIVALELDAEEIVGRDWLKNSLDRNLVDNLGKYRRYDAGSVRDLMRVIRNKVYSSVCILCMSSETTREVAERAICAAAQSFPRSTWKCAAQFGRAAGRFPSILY